MILFSRLKRDSLSHLLGSNMKEGVRSSLKKSVTFANNSGFANLSGLNILKRVTMTTTAITPAEKMNFLSFVI